MIKNRTYRILLDEKWALEDLMVFSRVYFQNYSFLYCLEVRNVEKASVNIESVLENYELRHGLSYVNIYDIFRSHVSETDKPQIKSIQYNSPGWLDLILNPEVATQFAKAIAVYLAAPVIAMESYKRLYRIYSDLSDLRKKARINSLKLEAQQLKEVQKLNELLAKGLGFESLTELDSHTKDKEESSKLLMAHCRRIKKIASFVESGKVKFPKDLHNDNN